MNRNWIKKLNEVIIEGKIKNGFLKKREEFSIRIYFTPKKKIIMGIDIKGISHKKLKLPFGVGDKLEDVQSWSDSKSFNSEYIERIF